MSRFITRFTADVPAPVFQDFDDGVYEMSQIREKADRIFNEIGTFWIKEISEGIVRQIENKNEEEKVERLPVKHDFISLLSLPKDNFLEYERKVRAGVKVTSPSKPISNTKSPKKKTATQKMEMDNTFERADEEEKVDLTGYTIKPKKRNNETRQAEKWEYKDADKIIRKDEGHMIYYRNDQTNTQKWMTVDSTVVLKSNITSRLKILSVKQLPDIYDLQLYIHDSIVKVENDGTTLLEEFMKNSFPNKVQRLTLFAALSKTKTEPVTDSLVETLWRIISTCVTNFVYLPDWNFTKSQLNKILNDCTYLECIDIRRNEVPHNRSTK